VVYRHFGAKSRHAVAQRLGNVAQARGLVLLIGADPDLARQVGAGVHWPERLAPSERGDAPLVTVAAHSREAAMRAGAIGDACILSPIFPTRSASHRRPLGLFAGSQIARVAPLPIIALGGVTAHTARLLSGRGFAGVAAVDAFLEA
jgi:thiamine-phosphate pyrophosphorylase